MNSDKVCQFQRLFNKCQLHMNKLGHRGVGLFKNGSPWQRNTRPTSNPLKIALAFHFKHWINKRHILRESPRFLDAGEIFHYLSRIVKQPSVD